MKKIIFVGAMLIVGLAHSQVGIGTRAPAGENPDTLAIDHPQGILHLQGQHYYSDSVNRNLGLVVTRVDSAEMARTPDGQPAIKGTMVFDSIKQCLRVKTADGENGWNGELANCLVSESNDDLTTVLDAYEGLTVNAKKVSAGDDFSLIIDADDGMLYSTGYNQLGETGQGTTSGSTTTFKMVLARTVTDMSAGYQHALAVDSTGNVWAWGSGANYRTGLGNTTNFTFPKKITNKGAIPAKVKAVRVEAGYSNSLVLCDDGKVYAFGANTNGVNGNNLTSNNAITPAAVGSLQHIKDIAISQFSAAAVDSLGNVWIWGNAAGGRLGNGMPSGSTPSPTQILSSYNIKQVALSDGGGLAISADGKHLYGWGDPHAWGENSTTTQNSPKEVTSFLPQTASTAITGVNKANIFNPASDTILYVAASRFRGTSNVGSLVITNKNVYAAGDANAAQTLGLGTTSREGATTATARYSPQQFPSGSGPWYTGFYPIYEGAIYGNVVFGQASMGSYHSLLLQRAEKRDQAGNLIKDKNGNIIYQGLGYGVGRVNRYQLGAVDPSYSPIYIFTLLKK